jgi:CRP/FNR family transcriptional regulator, anaerobic regulatory protein
MTSLADGGQSTVVLKTANVSASGGFFAPAATELVLEGARLLRQAFLEKPLQSARRDAVLISADGNEPAAHLIHRGIAYSSVVLPGGRRSIIDVLLPGDIVGIEYSVVRRPNHDVIAANELGYRTLAIAELNRLVADPRISARALALMAEVKWRADRHMTAVTRFDASRRIAGFLVGIYDRLRRRDLIARPTFNLPLTQEQIGDHLGLTMVHISRILRALREAKLGIVHYQVVIILDLDGLRALANGLPHLAV